MGSGCPAPAAPFNKLHEFADPGAVAHGLDEVRLADQLDRIAELNAAIADAGHEFRVLSGMEVDILEDGALDLSDDMLERLDVVVASVHSKLRMEKQQMTERMLVAVASRLPCSCSLSRRPSAWLRASSCCRRRTSASSWSA